MLITLTKEYKHSYLVLGLCVVSLDCTLCFPCAHYSPSSSPLPMFFLFFCPSSPLLQCLDCLQGPELEGDAQLGTRDLPRGGCRGRRGRRQLSARPPRSRPISAPTDHLVISRWTQIEAWHHLSATTNSSPLQLAHPLCFRMNDSQS